MARPAYDLLVFGYDGAGATVARYYTTEERELSGLGWAYGRLDSVLYQESLWRPLATRGPREVSHGSAGIVNADGDLDDLIDVGLDNGVTQIRYTPDLATPGTYTVIVTGYGEQLALDEAMANYYLRDSAYQFMRSVVPTRYAGSNSGSPLAGIEGTADDLKGLPKPLVLGRVFNITPKLVNTTKQIYQVDGQRGLQTGWDMTVYDKRSVLTRGSNYSSQADMEANAPTAGQYRVHPATGCFRLNATPAGSITVDVDNPSSLGGFEAFELGNDVCNYITGASISGAGCELESGVYIDSDRQLIDVVNELMSGEGMGWYFIAASSTLIQKYQLTTAGTSRTLNATQVIGDVRRVTSADDDRGIPAWKVTVNYAKNNTVMTDADLAGVAAADITFCQQQWRSEYDSDTAIKTQFPRAVEIVVDTALVDAADAAAEASRLLDLYGVPRDMLQVTIPTSEALTMLMGLVVTFTYPRFGLDSGKSMQIIGREFDGKAGTVTLTLWG